MRNLDRHAVRGTHHFLRPIRLSTDLIFRDGEPAIDDAGDATDADGAVWTVRLSQEPPAAERDGTGGADCELAGPAGQLYRALWNRGPFPSVSGDASLAVLWREKSAITWS